MSSRKVLFVDEDVIDPSVSSASSSAASPIRSRMVICDAADQRILQGRMTMNFKQEDQVGAFVIVLLDSILLLVLSFHACLHTRCRFVKSDNFH